MSLEEAKKYQKENGGIICPDGGDTYKVVLEMSK